MCAAVWDVATRQGRRLTRGVHVPLARPPLQLKVKLQQHNKRELQPHETSLIGAFAGGFTGALGWERTTARRAAQAAVRQAPTRCVRDVLHAGLVTTPLDVLKTRLMTQGASGTYRNLFDATARVRLSRAVLRRRVVVQHPLPCRLLMAGRVMM